VSISCRLRECKVLLSMSSRKQPALCQVPDPYLFIATALMLIVGRAPRCSSRYCAFAAEREEALCLWSNRIYLDSDPSIGDCIHRCDHGYCERNVHSIWRLSELCYEEKHWIFHLIYRLLAAVSTVGVLLRSNCLQTSIKG